MIAPDTPSAPSPRGGAAPPDSGGASVATLILNWNGLGDTVECLESLRRIRVDGWRHHVVVIDNASTDGSPERIAERFPEVTLLRNAENLGFAEGMNVGVAWAREQGVDHLILLNNDAVVSPDAFPLLLEQAARPNTGAVMPLIRHYDDGEVWYAGGRLIRPLGRVQPETNVPSESAYRTQLFTACCVLLPMRVLDRIGDFDPRYYLYLEDTDLALRLTDAGYDIWVEPRAVVRHKVSRSSGGAASPSVLYYLLRNNLLLIRDRGSNPGERWAGYGYVAALSAKIGLNVLWRRLPAKRAMAGAVAQAWGDFLRGRLGPRG